MNLNDPSIYVSRARLTQRLKSQGKHRLHVMHATIAESEICGPE
jgi:hypothetical protein